MQKWEYRAFELDNNRLQGRDETIEDYLNKFGKDGWELISFGAHYVSSNVKFHVVMKRPFHPPKKPTHRFEGIDVES